MKYYITSILIILVFNLNAQTAFDPSSDAYTFKMKPFHAQYTQMGSDLLVSTALSADGSGYNVTMSMMDMTNPTRRITDVIGLSSTDGSFVYRDFHMLVPSWIYYRARISEGQLILDGYNNTGTSRDSIAVKKPVFDGTFVYWQLGGVDSSKEEFRIQRWKQSPGGLVAGASPSFKSNGRETIEVGGKSYKCRVLEVEAAPGVKIICYVSDEVPYLIKQEFKQGDTVPQPVLTLVRVLE